MQRPQPARPCLGLPPVFLPSHPPPSRPPARAQDPKDTATLWDSLSVVEIADKFGQKLRRNSKWCEDATVRDPLRPPFPQTWGRPKVSLPRPLSPRPTHNFSAVTPRIRKR